MSEPSLLVVQSELLARAQGIGPLVLLCSGWSVEHQAIMLCIRNTPSSLLLDCQNTSQAGLYDVVVCRVI